MLSKVETLVLVAYKGKNKEMKQRIHIPGHLLELMHHLLRDRHRELFFHSGFYFFKRIMVHIVPLFPRPKVEGAWRL